MVYLKKALVSAVIIFTLLGLCYGSVHASGSSKTGIIKGNVVNLRKSPSTSSSILAKIEENTQVKVTDTSNDWYKVSYNGMSGWIAKSLITIRSTSLGTGTVTAEALNVRSGASTSSSKVAKLERYDRVSLLSRSGNWYKVKTSSGVTGWVRNDYVTTKKVSRGVVASDLSSAQEIIAYAKRYLGYNYVYGGTSPSGFDCSGFTQYVFEHAAGINLNRTAAEQARQGSWISQNDLIAGDLVFFDTNGGHNYVNHVGIYIGGGRFIHASSPRYGVLITDLSDYARSYMTARRVD